MTRFEIRVVPHTSLYVGGYAQALGGSDGDTASDPRGLLLPGSAVKGALREAAVRLVQGAGRGSDLLSTLFGADGQEGLLRVGTLRPELPVEGADGTVRNHVSLERATRQAAPQRLFQNRVTPARPGLSFRGVLESRETLSGETLGLLRSAVRITDQIGGGRGRGLGLVTVTLAELPPEEQASRGPEGATRLVLVLEAEEAIHLSGVKDPSNYVASKDYLDGSTVRGAVARALGGRPADPEMELLFGGGAPAVFGDGRPGGLKAVPAPMTVQEPKRGGTPYDLAVRLCADACGGQPLERPDDVRTARGTFACGEGGWRAVSLKRRTVTRTARDAASGRGADAQLYSLEILDPVRAEGGQGPGGLRFHVPVSGTPEQLALVLRAVGRGLAVGGDRSRGFGRLRLAEVVEPTLESVAERHRAWAEAVGRRGVPIPESTGVLLALGPLAVSHERLVAELRAEGLELREGVARRQTHSGWNARLQLPRTVSSHYVPGSTFIVARPDGGSALPALARLEERGIGPGRADGWGLLAACHPIHLDPFCDKEGKKLSSLSPTQRRAIDLAKERLVIAAETLLETSGVRPDQDDFGHSQLRNLGAVAAETESPAVVLNFIRYQMGRDDKQKGWARGAEGSRVGDLFLADLGGEGGAISLALAKVKDWQDDPTRDQIAKMELIRYFLGFATRYMKYLELRYPKRKKGGRS